MAKSIRTKLQIAVRYTISFVIHSFSACIVYAAFVGVSKVTCYLGYLVPFDGYVHALIFKVVELAFLGMGALGAIAHVAIQLSREIYEDIWETPAVVDKERTLDISEEKSPETKFKTIEVEKVRIPIKEIKEKSERPVNEDADTENAEQGQSADEGVPNGS